MMARMTTVRVKMMLETIPSKNDALHDVTGDADGCDDDDALLLVVVVVVQRM